MGYDDMTDEPTTGERTPWRAGAPAVTRAGLRLTISERRWLLWLGDSVACLLALLAAFWLWTFTRGEPLGQIWAQFGYLTPWLVGVWLLVGWLLDLYNPHVAVRLALVVGRLAALAAIVLVGYLLLFFVLAPTNILIRLPLVYYLLLALTLVASWRWLLVRLGRGGRSGSKRSSWALVGLGRLSANCCGSRRLRIFRWWGSWTTTRASGTCPRCLHRCWAAAAGCWMWCGGTELPQLCMPSPIIWMGTCFSGCWTASPWGYR
jgi:hypothetical protein